MVNLNSSIVNDARTNWKDGQQDCRRIWYVPEQILEFYI